MAWASRCGACQRRWASRAEGTPCAFVTRAPAYRCWLLPAACAAAGASLTPRPRGCPPSQGADREARGRRARRLGQPAGNHPWRVVGAADPQGRCARCLLRMYPLAPHHCPPAAWKEGSSLRFYTYIYLFPYNYKCNNESLAAVCSEVLMDYDSLQEAGTYFGTGAVIVMDKSTDVIEAVRRRGVGQQGSATPHSTRARKPIVCAAQPHLPFLPTWHSPVLTLCQWTLPCLQAELVLQARELRAVHALPRGLRLAVGHPHSRAGGLPRCRCCCRRLCCCASVTAAVGVAATAVGTPSATAASAGPPLRPPPSRVTTSAARRSGSFSN